MPTEQSTSVEPAIQHTQPGSQQPYRSSTSGATPQRALVNRPSSTDGAGLSVLRRSPDLLLLFASAGVLPLMLIVPFAIIRIPVGIMLVLFIPGYALTAALFSRDDGVSGGTRLALSFGLSIAVLPLIALAIELSPALIHPTPIAFALSAWVVFWSLVALQRRQRSNPAGHAFRSPADRASRLGLALFLIATTMGITLAVFLLPISTTPDATTEFYMLGEQGEARDYPRQAEVGQPVSVTIGIVNNDAQARQYVIEMWIGDLHGSQGMNRLSPIGPVIVAANQTHEQSISWSMPTPGEDKVVTILLYREDDGLPHRTLQLYLDVTDLDGA